MNAHIRSHIHSHIHSHINPHIHGHVKAHIRSHTNAHIQIIPKSTNAYSNLFQKLTKHYFSSAELSEFRSDVRNLGRTFEIPAGDSKFGPDVRNNEYGKMQFEAQERVS